VKGCGKLERYYAIDSGEETSQTDNLNYFKKGSEEWGIPLDPPVIGIAKKPNRDKSISVYPNPVNNSLLLAIPEKPEDNEFKLVITDSKGTIKLEKQITSLDNSLDVSNWYEGIYFYNLSYGSYSKSGKILVMH